MASGDQSELAVSPNTQSVCQGRKRVKGFTSALGISPWGKERGANHFENSTLTFTKKTDRCFSSIYRAEGRGEVEGRLHLITIVYSLHPLDKFTSLKGNLQISRDGAGQGRWLIFTVCLAQFNGTCPPLLISVTDSDFHFQFVR